MAVAAEAGEMLTVIASAMRVANTRRHLFMPRRRTERMREEEEGEGMRV